MRILICHGYLLSGTGSNQYVQALARAFCRQGHHTIIACQDDDPRLDFVSVFLEEGEGGRPRPMWEQETDYPGTCMVFKPDIGDLLPVYVLDSYPGFEVKEFVGLSNEELESYVSRNRSSLERLITQFVPDVVVANHAVMLPAIVRPVAESAQVPYFVCIHGSSIDFTVKRDDRYLVHGSYGLAGASKLFVPSEHTGKQVLGTFADTVPGLEEKVLCMPPGVDTHLFEEARVELGEGVERLLQAVAERTEGVTAADFGPEKAPGGDPSLRDIGYEIDCLNARCPAWMPDEALAFKMDMLVLEASPFVVFLGKLLETKGIQCVLAAMPLLKADHPEARLVVIGFGELKGLLELMLDAMEDGDVERLRELCLYGDRHSTRAERPFTPVLQLLDDLQETGALDGYLEACAGIRGSIIFTGYLTLEEHRYLLCHARAVLAPSLAPEAFGMVVVEGMAAGALPVASYQSGLESALEPARDILGEAAGSLFLAGRERMVEKIAGACGLALEMEGSRFTMLSRELRGLARQRFSWDAAASKMVGVFEDTLSVVEEG